MFDESIFWPHFKAAGMLVAATVRPKDCTLPVSAADVEFTTPDATDVVGNAISRQYVIEYQHADLPALAEGDEVEINGAVYRVRQNPVVAENTPSGFFRRAMLTRLDDTCA